MQTQITKIAQLDLSFLNEAIQIEKYKSCITNHTVLLSLI